MSLIASNLIASPVRDHPRRPQLPSVTANRSPSLAGLTPSTSLPPLTTLTTWGLLGFWSAAGGHSQAILSNNHFSRTSLRHIISREVTWSGSEWKTCAGLDFKQGPGILEVRDQGCRLALDRCLPRRPAAGRSIQMARVSAALLPSNAGHASTTRHLSTADRRSGPPSHTRGPGRWADGL